MCCNERFFINCFKVSCLLELILSIICLAKQIQTANYEDQLFIDGISDYKSKGQMIYLSLFLVCLAFGIIGLIYSFKHAKFKWIVILTLILNLSLIGYFSALIAAKEITDSSINTYIGESSSDCITKNFFKECQQLYAVSKDYWCKNDCPCSIKDPTKWEPFFWKDYSYNTGNPTDTFQECAKFETTFKQKVGMSDSEYLKHVNFLIAVENRFQCSQLCEVSKIYTFYSASNGIPDQDFTCHDYLLEFIKSYIGSFRLIGVIGLSLNLVQLFLCNFSINIFQFLQILIGIQKLYYQNIYKLEISHLISQKCKKNKVAIDNSKAISLPKSNHDESYIKKKGAKQKDAL